MKITNLLLVPFLSLAVFAGQDITVNDTYSSHAYGYDPRGIDESGFTGLYSIASAEWDLRGWGVSGNQLSYFGGFNPLHSLSGFNFGDIFFNTDNNISGSPIFPSYNGYIEYINPNFEYSIHFTGVTGNALQYDIYQLTENSKVLSAYFSVNRTIDPVLLVVDGNSHLIGHGSSLVSTASNSDINLLFNTAIGTNIEPNYLSSFDVGFLGGDSYTVVGNLTCGNDAVRGTYISSIVPECSTNTSIWALAGICGLLYLKRR